MKTKFKTIVIKIGSSSLTDKQGKLDIPNLKRIAKELAKLRKEGKNLILVTSGAIVCGSERLNIKGKPRTIPAKQAAAAVGQSLLMKEYIKAFNEHDITVAQVLLTRDAIANRERYVNARNTFSELLKMGVIPIVNENDTVSIDEIKIGDNDTLSALVASLIGADILIMLTDVDGFMMKDEDGELMVQHEVDEITKDIENAAKLPSTQAGTGGMITKIQAANICSHAGIIAAIGNSRKPNVIEDLLSGKKTGTIFKARVSKLEPRKRWLAHGLQVKGILIIDGGAETALIKGKKSLLPIGIKSVEGSFSVGDSVSVMNEARREIARGLTNFSSEDLLKIAGERSEKLSEILKKYETVEEVIHRDNLVLIEKELK